LASGDIDLIIEAGLQIYDVAALVPILIGAGGIITNWRGESGALSGQILAAGDARIHAESLIALKRVASV